MNPAEFGNLGWPILAIVVQATVVVLVAAVVADVGLRRRPAARHAVWLCALACTLAGPVAASFVDRVGLTLPIIPWTGAAAAEPGPPPAAEAEALPTGAAFDPIPTTSVPASRPIAPKSHVPPVAPSRTAEPEAGAPAPEKTKSGPFRMLAIVWGAGVSLGLGRLAVGWFRLRGLRRSLRPFDAGGVSIEVREALGDFEPPTIGTSPLVASPVAIGLRRPVVVLPEGLAETLAPDELRDVLIHECAHVRRHDVLVGVLQRIAAAFYWPHPLIHYMNSRLARAREEVCDNFVLRRGDPCGYARTLLKLTECRRAGAAAYVGIGLMDARWSLRDRIAGLLDSERDIMIQSNRRAVGAAVPLLTFACLAVAGLRPVGTTVAEASPGPQEPAAVASDRTIRGVVVDEAGKPAAGATVRLMRGWKSPQTAKTGADGRFTLPIGGVMIVEEELVASADDGARMGLGKHVEPQSSTPAEPLRIVLKPSRSVLVQVRDRAGNAVPGASVEAVGFDYHVNATTGAAGEATLRIPADAETRWIVGLKSGVGFDYYENYGASTTEPSGPVPPKVSLKLDGARTVRIKAVDTVGRPVPNVVFQPWLVQKPGKIDAANIGGMEIGQARTGEDGVAVFDWIPPFTQMGTPFLILPGAYSCPQTLSCESGDGPAELRVQLQRNVPVGGVVRDAEGRPVPGVLIRVEGRGATGHYCRAHARTGADGSYSVEVDPGQSYMIGVLDDRRAARTLTGIVVREGRPRSGLDLKLGEAAVIRGRVTRKSSGAPVVGDAVTLIQLGETLPKDLVSPRGNGDKENLPMWATTDADGRYRFVVAPGRYELLGPDAAGEVRREEMRLEIPVEIVRNFSLRLEPLKGVVVEDAASGGRPLAGAIVRLSPAAGRPLRESWITNGAGSFDIPIDRNGDHVVYVRDRDGGRAGFAVVEEKAVDVKIVAAPAARIRGRVVDTAGRPRANQLVQFRLGIDHPIESWFHATAKTDAEGRYEFGGVLVGWGVAVYIPRQPNPNLGGGVEFRELKVSKAGPVELPELVVPVEKAPAAKP